MSLASPSVTIGRIYAATPSSRIAVFRVSKKEIEQHCKNRNLLEAPGLLKSVFADTSTPPPKTRLYLGTYHAYDLDISPSLFEFFEKEANKEYIQDREGDDF